MICLRWSALLDECCTVFAARICSPRFAGVPFRVVCSLRIPLSLSCAPVVVILASHPHESLARRQKCGRRRSRARFLPLPAPSRKLISAQSVDQGYEFAILARLTVGDSRSARQEDMDTRDQSSRKRGAWSAESFVALTAMSEKFANSERCNNVL
eukprot:3924111-Rhodomonas_salina.3